MSYGLVVSYFPNSVSYRDQPVRKKKLRYSLSLCLRTALVLISPATTIELMHLQTSGKANKPCHARDSKSTITNLNL